MKRKRTTAIPLSQLKFEDGSDELARSPNMKPYLCLIEAACGGQDLKAGLEQLKAVPLEKRYLWRVVSALKWAFADFDSVCVKFDWMTLDESDLAKVWEWLQVRPLQLCLLMKALLGQKGMKQIMNNAIRHA